MSTAPDLFAPGEVIAGTYEIRSKIGEGGMGQVYAAFDRALRRWVAIKAGCSHSGGTVIVAEHLHRYRLPGSGLPYSDAVDLLARVADALAVVHGAGVAHGDVKPDNILRAPRDRIVLTDFGLFQTDLGAARRPLAAGSPHYMAPETFLGSVGQGELHLVDVYALGVVAYELIVGRVPFDGEKVSRVLWLHVQQPAPDPCVARRDCPASLGALVREMLAKDPLARPQTMEEVAWRLRHLPRLPRARARREGLRPGWV